MQYITRVSYWKTALGLSMVLFAQLLDPNTTRVMYNGHKRIHSIKLQSVVLPNGIIANLAGPYEGKRHDSTMLHESELLGSLHQIAFQNN